MFISDKSPAKSPIEVQCLSIITQAFDATVADFQKRLDAAEARANDVGLPTIRTDIVRCDQVGKLYSPSSYVKDGYYVTRNAEQLEAHVNGLIDNALAQAAATHAANAEAIASNVSLRTKIEKLMISIGLTKEVRVVDEKSRARLTKYVSVPSGWANDISSIRIDDGYEAQCNIATRLRKELKDFADKMRNEEAKKRLADEAAKKTEAINRGLGVILARYELSPDTSAYDALSHILNQSKYLMLGDALLRNRNDWNDGCSEALAALRSFLTVTDEDRAIYEELMALCDDWDDDGRVFGTARYGYGYLFSKVDPQLYKDYAWMTANFPSAY